MLSRTFSAIKSVAKEKIYSECPSCREKMFYQVNLITVGTSIFPVQNIVGTDTGVCAKCGAMAHGEIYLTNLDEGQLVDCAFFNNNAYIQVWLDFMADISLENGPGNEDYDLLKRYGPKIERLNLQLYTLSKFPEFLGICIAYNNNHEDFQEGHSAGIAEIFRKCFKNAI